MPVLPGLSVGRLIIHAVFRAYFDRVSSILARNILLPRPLYGISSISFFVTVNANRHGTAHTNESGNAGA